MKSLNISILSKERNSINNFIAFLALKFHRIGLNHLKKIKGKTTKKNVITLLTSPRVHKTAQEHFEILFFKKDIYFYSTDCFKHLIVLKKIKTYMFPNLKIKIKLASEKKKCLTIKMFNIDNFYKKLRIQSAKNRSTLNLSKSLKFLKILDIYGELNL